MNADEFARYDGLGLADLIRRREVSAGEVLDCAIARVEALNPSVNAVVNRLYDQARAAVAASLPVGPFTGVPYLLKDLGAHYAGAVTTFGSALFKDFVVDHDSEITARLKRLHVSVQPGGESGDVGAARDLALGASHRRAVRGALRGRGEAVPPGVAARGGRAVGGPPAAAGRARVMAAGRSR